MSHTPGSWHIGLRPGPMIYGPKGEQVASLTDSLLSREETAANARLIKAAPALLRALERLLEHEGERETDGIGIEHDSEALENAKRAAYAAITQAKGE